MRKEIIINSAINEVRIAITEDGHLAEYFVEQPEKEKLLGNIYYGKVSKVSTALNAAFVDVGLNVDAFLHFSDVEDSSSFYNTDNDENDDNESDIDANDTDDINSNDSDSVEEDDENQNENTDEISKEFAVFSTRSSGDIVINLKENSEVLVQVVREAYAHKGMKVTTKIGIPGHYVVLLPFEKSIGISKKIRNEIERRRLRKLARRKLPKGMGCIIRTASVGKYEEELISD
jgi:ribonuclease G